MEYKYYDKKMEKCISFNEAYDLNNDEKKVGTSCEDFLMNSSSYMNDDYLKLNIFTIIKNEIINVLSVIKKHEYNKNLDSSIVDALFILYNNINNLNNNLKEEIEIHDFNNKLDIYHIAPFLNIIRNNNIFYKIKLSALQSLDHILKYNSSYFNDKYSNEHLNRKQISYLCDDYDNEVRSNNSDHICKRDIINESIEKHWTKDFDDKQDGPSTKMLNEKVPKKKKYHFFSKNYKLHKKYHLDKEEAEENFTCVINKGNNIINISIETLLNAPINYHNMNYEEIILYDTMILFNNILMNSIKVVDKNNIIKIICYIFKIYKSTKYSLLFKGNCESILINIFHVVMKSYVNNIDDDFIHDILTIILILINNNKNKFVLDLLNKKDFINLYNELFENEMSHENLENINILSFSLLNILIEVYGYSLINKNFDSISNIIRCLFIHITSSSYVLICKALRSYINIFILYKKHFFIYNEIFINILLNTLKKGSSKNITETALLTLSHFCLENVLFEIYYNYDVNLYASDLLQNFIKSILELCVNFVHNTTIINEVIFKMIKNILYILVPYANHTKQKKNNDHHNHNISHHNHLNSLHLHSNDSYYNHISIHDMTHNTHDCGYINQLIIEFKNDIYSDTYNKVFGSRKRKKGRKRTSIIHEFNIKDKDKEDEHENENKDEDHNKKHSINNNNNNYNSGNYYDNEGNLNQHIIDNRRRTSLSKKEAINEFIDRYNDNKNELKKKKHNLNELYSLNFLSSSTKDNRFVTFCALLLFEHFREYVKVKYIKKKKHIMRKKKRRKEILKKSATIFNTLKGKAVDELIKMRIIQTQETFNNIDSNYAIIDSEAMHKDDDIIEYSSSLYENRSFLTSENGFEKGSSIKSNSFNPNTHDNKTQMNNSNIDMNLSHNSYNHDELENNRSLINNHSHFTTEESCDERNENAKDIKKKKHIKGYTSQKEREIAINDEDEVDENNNNNDDGGNDVEVIKQENKMLNGIVDENISRNDKKKKKNSSNIHNNVSDDHSVLNNNSKSSIGHYEKNVEGQKTDKNDNTENNTINNNNIDDDENINNNYTNEEISKKESDLHKMDNNQKKKKHHHHMTATEIISSVAHNFSKKHFKHSTKNNLMEDEYFVKSMAKFVRYNPFLDKEFVGEYISHRKNINLLKRYVRLFDFCNLSLLSSLRLFLRCFKLPGEAQLIERILEHFSLCFFYSNPIHGDLSNIYKVENDKVVCLVNDEELANKKRYILIDFLNENSNKNNVTHDDNVLQNGNESDAKKSVDQNNNENDSNINESSTNVKKHNVDNNENCVNDLHIEEKINLKKNVNINDYMHKNVYYLSKKIEGMSEEEIQKKYVLVENSDVIFILTYSIIMLNTDLHNNQVKNKMKLEEFIKNNRGINNGKNIDRIYLENLYNCILNEEIKLFSNTQNTYTNDDQYWKLLDQKKEEYKYYHSFKKNEIYFYKYDINKLLIRNNFLPIFFELFKRTNDYNLIEHCTFMFKMVINNLAYYHDLGNINKIGYIFKYINFYLTQKCQSLLYLFFHFIKKCYNSFRNCWSIYINIIFKLITVDLLPIFFYPHIFINNTQFNIDKDFLSRKSKKGNTLETYNINKSITETYQHPFLMFKKNVKKLNKSKWIDDFSSMFFSRHSTNENNNLSIIFKDSGNYNEKIEEIKNQIKEKEKEKKKKKKNDKVKDKVNGQENEHDNLNKNKKKNNEDIKHDDRENEKHSEEHHKADHNDIDEEDDDEDDDDDDIDDDDNDYDDDYEDDDYIDDDNDNYYNLNDNNNNDHNDELEYIYVNIKADPKNIDTSAIIDNVNLYKKLKLDIYNFFTFNDFHNNMITNLNISSFIYLIKILIIKCSIKKENEIHNVSAHHTNKSEVHHHSFLKSPTMSHNHNNNYLTNDKGGSTFNVNDYINDTNPIIVNSESSFDQFYHSKEKLLSTQMFFHIMCYKINYTYILYNMLCKLKLKSYRRINRFIEKGEVHELNLYMKQIHEERKCKNINHEERNKKNYFDLTLNNIYDTDNTSDAELSDSDYSDISNDSFFVKRKERILVDIYMHSHEGRGEKHRDERNRNINHIDHNHNHDDHFDNSKYVDEDDLYDHYYYHHHEHKHKRLHEEQNEEYDEYKEMYNEFDKIYSYADSTDEEREDGHDEEHSYEHTHHNHNHDEDEDSTYLSDDKEHGDVFNSIYYSKHKGGHNVKGNFHITNDGNLNKNLKRSKQYLIDKIKMDLYMKTYIMHIKIIVFTFEHYFNLLNSYLLINYDSSIFINIYNSIFKNYKMDNVKVMTEEDISNDKSYNFYDTNFEDINKKINYKEEEEEEDEEKRININDIENNLFTVKMEKSETEEDDWLFIEQLIMSIMNFSYLCFNIYKENKVHISKKLLKKMHMNGDTVRRICLELQKRNKKFFFLCGIYLIYILQFLKKNILYRFIDKIIFVLEKISKNVYVNSCIINIYLNMLQLITPNNILYKNTNNTNISLNDKDIYIYIEKATIYTESINNIINNNNVLLKLNNFNIENIILSLLPYLLYFNNKKEEINSHIASINSECLHIISNIYYKSIYMYMNNNINHRDNDKHIKMKKNNTGLLLNSECDMEKHQDISYENIIELKKMYIFLLTCFVLSLACSFSSKRTRSEAYIKLQQFLFNESYIFKRVNKKEDNNNNNKNNSNSNNNNSNNNNNSSSSNKNSKEEKYVYRDEKLIDLISNFIILPLITYNYYFPFICKNKYRGISNDEDDGNMKQSDNEIKDSEPSSENLLTLDQNNYCKEALLNYNLFHKKNHVSNMSEEMWKNNEYENCGCIINYKNLENIEKDNIVLNNILNYANDYYIHTILHKQYNYYFSYLYAKKMLTYDNVCYRKSMSISFVSHIMLSFLYSLLNCSDDIYDDEKKQTNNLLNSELKNNKTKETHNNDEDKILNLYSLLCLNNEAMYNKIVTKGKCESNCIYYFLKHFYHSLLTIKEEANKILNIYKETFIENMKNIIYVSSSYAYCLKDHRISCFSHIKNGYYFLREQEKNIYIKLHNVQNIHDKEYPQELDNDVVKNIKKLQLNVRISIVIVYYILYMDNNSNEQFKATFEELLNVLLTKYSDNEHVEKDEQKKENEVKEAQTNDDKEKTVVTSNNENNTGKKVDTVNVTNDKKEDNVKDLKQDKEDNVKDLNEHKEDNLKDLNEDKEDNIKDLNEDKEDNVKDLNEDKEDNLKHLNENKEDNVKDLNENNEDNVKDLNQDKEDTVKDSTQDKEDNIKDLTEEKVDENINISNEDEALEKPQALEEQGKQDDSHSSDEKDEKQN